MRRHVIPLLGMVLLAFGSASFLVAQTPDSAEIMFEAARQMELIDGDLEAAIEQYAEIVDRHPDRRAIVAQALLRMGSGYDKLGSAEARTIYEQVVNDYADQPEQVTTAKAKLAAMRLSAESTVARTTAQTMTLRELMRSSELSPGEVARPTGDAVFAVSGDGQLFIYTDWGTGDLALMNLATGRSDEFTQGTKDSVPKFSP
ncbi:MAG: tetratricopeptide repeat protein, partial [Acidobacteria bacterium]|nr:tetratricopeptide repeat protein [Acidobacteriota bacterium]